MADDSLELKKDEVPFHPCLSPRGLAWYDFNILTPLQQKLLNELKIEVVRENNHYFERHPEVRAIVAIFLRAVLYEQPRLKTIADFAKDFFSRPPTDIQAEIDQYLKEREPLKKDVGESAMDTDIEVQSPKSSAEDVATLFHPLYSYYTFTDEQSFAEEMPEWSGYEEIERLHKPTRSMTDTFYTSTTEVTTTDSLDRRQFELLFASRASLHSGESSLEASTIDMTKEYMAYYGGLPSDKSSSPVSDDEEVQAIKEMRLSEDINDKLSVIIENVEEEDQEENEFDYEHIDKRYIIEMDLETLKGKQTDESVHATGPRPSNESFVLETMLDYTISAEG